MIFQDPMTALHPYYTVGAQITEAYLVHNKVGKKAARKHAVDMLGRVGIPQPAARVDDYPHQFSGGMRQRAMIAMALSCDPELLIADEPTTALDVTIQAQILDLIWDLQQESTPRSSSSPTTWAWWPSCPTTSWSCTRAGWRSTATAEDIFDRPGIPTPGACSPPCPASTRRGLERLLPIQGTPPSLISVPPGCPFHPRCRYASLTDGRSQTEVPSAARGGARAPGRVSPDG